MEEVNETTVEPTAEVANPVASLLEETIRALKLADPSAFLVVARVVRRVIKHEWDLPALATQVPHRKAWVIKRNNLIKLVDWDELGLAPDSPLPDSAILLARPDDKQLEKMTVGQLKLQCWRHLLHARIHLAFDRLCDSGQLTSADFRERIHRLGQVEFDEIQTVLRRENFVRSDTSLSNVYIEFAALYSELKYFAPHCLTSYFPSFEQFGAVDALIAQDVDADALFRATRIEGSPNPFDEEIEGETEDETTDDLDSLTGHIHAEALVDQTEESQAASVEGNDDSSISFPNLVELVASQLIRASKPHERSYSRYIRKADKEFGRGNAVAAAIAQMKAARVAVDVKVNDAINGALTDIQRLVKRLQVALVFDDVTAIDWYISLVGLLVHSIEGFWSADKRLLHDLQKVCVDHEREIYTVDLVRWALSAGRGTLKRTLPNQREVLMSKHLSNATHRLVASKLTGTERRKLSGLLHEAAHSAEYQMRTRLRPLTQDTLEEVGLSPNDVPERVAFNKLTEELLDGVAKRGFLNMGNLRDAISRSNLKLTDLKGPIELTIGDRLLRADKKLKKSLDGVYRNGEFYMRLLQRFSSLLFGTHTGRFVTRFLAIPYGVAFIAISAIVHIVELFVGGGGHGPPKPGVPIVHHPTIEFFHDHTWLMVALIGSLVLGVVHIAPFRRLCGKGLSKILSGLRTTCYEWPMRFFRQGWVRRSLKSTTVVLVRRFILTPLIPTVIICWLLPSFYDSIPKQEFTNWLIVLAAMSVILNSRVGRDVEELTAEWLHTTWNRIRVHVFIAMFELIMESFKRMLEWVERVLYAVDEWLRFKSGETEVSLFVKGVLGIVWGGFAFVIRFAVNLLIEPQINPIKHFPVVTVSHKIILPLGFPGGMLSQLLQKVIDDPTTADTVAGTTVFLIPGIFGFLVWEFKSNWQLYQANRGDNLKPVVVGSHGETFIRLMKPGFHSGTLPKLFGKLRRVDRRRRASDHSLARSRYLDSLHHVHADIEHFIEREFLSLLRETSSWQATDMEVAQVRLASNNVRVELSCQSISAQPLTLVFEEQSGWLVASTFEMGWLREVSHDESEVFMRALVGFYRLAGVDLVREQIAASFSPRQIPYDVSEEGLIVWPDGKYAEEAIYNLHHHVIRPYPRSVARTWSLPNVESETLIFAQTRLSWSTWSRQWDEAAEEKPAVLPDEVRWSWNNVSAASNDDDSKS
jgi:hypothetical protein